MKKNTIRVLALLLIAGLLCTFAAPEKAQAASVKKKLKSLINCMSSFEYDLLVFNDIELNEVREVTLNKTVMAKAAALSCSRTYVSQFGEWDFEALYTVPAKSIKKMAKKMFGKTVTYKNLPKGNAEEASGFVDAYLNADGVPEIYVWEGETETDYETVKTTYKKTDKGYDVIRDIFCGYWRINEYYKGKKSNYRVIYHTEKNKASSYGYVITGMTIERTAELTLPDEGEG